MQRLPTDALQYKLHGSYTPVYPIKRRAFVKFSAF